MIARETIFKLLPDRRGPCISLYIPSCDTGGPEQHAVRFQNLLRCIENDLQLYHVSDIDIDALVANVQPQHFSSPFWRESSQGVAAFLASGFCCIEHLPYRIAMQYRLANRFHILPLLPLIDPFQRFFVLKLDQGNARCFEATPQSIREIDLSERGPNWARMHRAPTSSSNGARHEPVETADSQRRHVTANQGKYTSTMEEPQIDLLESLRAIDLRLHRSLLGEQAPLIIAGFGFVASLYEGVNSYRHLLPVRIPGSPSSWTTDELHARAADIVMPFLERDRQLALSEFAPNKTRFQTTTVPSEAVTAAEQGRVKTLFVARGGECDGFYDRHQHTLTLDPSGEDLLEYAVARTLINGGQSCVLDRDEMPGGQTLAAILRRDSPTFGEYPS